MAIDGSRKPDGIRKGRFKDGMDTLFERFNSSLAFDRRLFRQDIRGSIAHARMLGRQGIISEEEALAIEQGLNEVLSDLVEGRCEFRDELEDVHINIETFLKEKIGDVAGKLHTARSRNDQVALDLRMYVREQSFAVREGLVDLMVALVEQAAQNIEVVLPGYTHLQRAQPVRLAHHLLAYFEMFHRDWERLEDSHSRVNRMPLGAAALAGTTFPIERESTAAELEFDDVCLNSMDAVSDRDFALEFLFNCSMVMMHLSRLAEELIVWSSQEFAFCTLPDAYCSGSSIMPQKKNPDACELVRGKSGRVFGDLVALFTTLKALPLTYNKDLQEDKEPVFDAADTVTAALGVMSGLIPGIRFHGDTMLKAASDPSLAATDLADSLARAGIPFREAHSRIGEMIRHSAGLSVEEEDGKEIPGPEEMVEARSHTGGTARSSVDRQIRAARTSLDTMRKADRTGNRKDS